MVQSVNHKEVLGGQQLCAPFADPVDNGKHRFVENQPIQRDTDEEVIRAGKVGKRLCLLHTQLKHQIHSLTEMLHHAAEKKNFCDIAVARESAIQYVVECDASPASTYLV